MRSFFTTFFIFITYSLIAKEVPKHLAERIANNFYSNEYARSSTKLSLTYQENLSDDKAAYYVFNVVNNPGFIIISGDDISEPILGYSDESNFHYDDNSSNPAISWLKYYKIQIENAIANGVKQSVENKEKWTNYANNVFPVKSRSTVNPLCASKWGQSPYENAQTPVDSTANNAAKRCVTGCPATAMAVIMKYHKHPAQGTGSFSYNHPKYGTLSVNFADQTYNWDNMPDLITPQTQEQIKGECAKLMSHLGISVSMQYTANSSGASPIGDEGCEGSYKKYFGYDANTVRSIRKNDSTDVAWKEVLKKELRENRPIQYAGFGNGGHTWICDGFDANDKFHMNWGWGGYLDGYFALDALAPGTGGDGAGAGTYNNNQLAVIGIKPALQQLTSAPKYGLAMSSNITSSVAKIKMNQPFSVKASLNYNSALPYTADIAAIVATESGELVDYVDYLEGKSFTNGATQEFTFETPGIPLIPGKYKIGIYSAGPKDSLWTLINQKDFTNPLLVEVESNPNDLSLASKINIPTSIVENTDFKFTADVINTSTSEYKGFVQFAMYDKDGDVYYFADENLDIALTLGAGEKKNAEF
jgi:hypothetical protein